MMMMVVVMRDSGEDGNADRVQQHGQGPLLGFCWGLALDVLYHTVNRELCRCQVKDVHGLQSFVSANSEESVSLLFILCLQ